MEPIRDGRTCKGYYYPEFDFNIGQFGSFERFRTRFRAFLEKIFNPLPGLLEESIGT